MVVAQFSMKHFLNIFSFHPPLAASCVVIAGRCQHQLNWHVRPFAVPWRPWKEWRYHRTGRRHQRT